MTDTKETVLAMSIYALCLGYLLYISCPIWFALPLALLMAGIAVNLLAGIIALAILPLSFVLWLIELTQAEA